MRKKSLMTSSIFNYFFKKAGIDSVQMPGDGSYIDVHFSKGYFSGCWLMATLEDGRRGVCQKSKLLKEDIDVFTVDGFPRKLKTAIVNRCLSFKSQLEIKFITRSAIVIIPAFRSLEELMITMELES